MELFCYQAKENPVYAAYINYLGIDPGSITGIRQIPFLPISFFKDHQLICGDKQAEIVFQSSGTGGKRSKHFLASADLYRKSFTACFDHFFGDPACYRILGLLPSYLEREGSSLIFMVDEFIQTGNHPESGFYLDEFDQLAQQLYQITSDGLPAILFGVSFALLDFAESHAMPLGENIIIMETGGMKGRREEITREELHERLKIAFGKENIYAEYGMTELLSQAYSKGKGRFSTPPWMEILIRDIHDPLSLVDGNTSGGINIIDLANIHSCAFIETQDIGRVHKDGTFEVLGRTDASDLRGCSLLIA